MATYRSIISLLSSYGLLLIANGLFSTLVSIRSKVEGFSDTTIGIVLSCYFAGILLSSFYAAKVVSLIGHIRAFASFGTLSSVIALAHLLWVEPNFWGLLRLGSGFCMGGMIVVTQGWLNERATNKNRGSILSLYMITTYACAGAAQFILMLDDPDGFRLFILTSILFSFALIPLLVTRSSTPSQAKPNRPNIKRLYKTSPVGMLGSLVVGYITSIFYAMAPVFAQSIGLGIAETATFIALSILSGMLLQFPLGRLSDKIDRRWVIALSTALTSIACLILFVIDTSNHIALFAAAIFYGSVAFSINPICVAHTNDLAPSNERTQTSSGLLMFYGIGAILGPTSAGFTITNNPHNIYLISGITTFLFSAYTIIRLIVKPRDLKQKSKFRPFSVQSPARGMAYRDKDLLPEQEKENKQQQ